MGTAAHATALHYEQRRPQTTPLYRLIATHLETFLAEARAAHDRGVPRYVERELRAYLACGIHTHGFLRARCSTCRKEMLVAFSCKLRGVCPSCNARRMCSTAAHLTDRVFPDVPIRHWVLSVPFELRLLLARNAAALSAVGRIFVREIWRWQREQFRASLLRGRKGEASRPPTIRGGAVCFPQRFGGSLNLNVHYHVAVPDGVFGRASQGADVVFHQLPIPNRADLEAIGHAVELRVLRWLRRRGLLDADEAEQSEHDAQRQCDALDACLRGSLGIGELSSLPGSASAAGQGADEDAPSPNPRALTGALASRGARSSRGFDIHAGVSVSAHDREGRERLPVLRPTPAQPRAPQRTRGLARRVSHQESARSANPPRDEPDAVFRATLRPHPTNSDAPLVPPGLVESGGPAARGARVRAAISLPAEITVARDARIDWATLLKLVHEIDALACTCGGRLSVIALITEPEVVVAILTSLRLPAAPPPIARARSPDYQPARD